MKFIDIYSDILRQATARQRKDGSMPAGHNGPYFDPETPVRNTSHYLIGFHRAYELTGELSFKISSAACLDYLLKLGADISDSGNFECRIKTGKDRCNGLIGPAWAIEALLYAANKMKSSEAEILASKIFLRHPFDAELGLWSRVDTNGNLLGLDPTFNHQLWFAAVAAPLAQSNSVIRSRIDAFLGRTKSFWNLAHSGRIVHPLLLGNRRLKEPIKRMLKPTYRREILLKEVGYHAFNLVAFCILTRAKIFFPNHVENKLNRALDYLYSYEFEQCVERSAYGYAYNPPGWEVPLALITLGCSHVDEAKPWIERQLKHSYDPVTKQLSLNVKDPETHTARMYEIASAPNELFDLPIAI